METRWYSYDFGMDQDKIIAEHKIDPADRIVLLGEMEWELHVDKLIPFCKEKNIDLVLVHGCGRSEYHEQIYKELGYDIDKVVFFDRHWPLYTEEMLSRRLDYTKYEHNKFTYPFICMNNRAHLHRCVLIDELARQDLINKGLISWHNFLDNASSYKFKHFDEKIRRLNDGFETMLDSLFLPKSYENCFLDVIGEATHLCPIMSEKTLKPILLKKPFLTLSCKHYYRHVQDLGFVLYDEVFDYSFDDVDDITLRAKLFVDNIQKIIGMDYDKLYKQLLPKLIYNMENVLRLKQDINSIPEIIKEYVSYLKNNGRNKQGKDYRLWHMLDNAMEST